MRDKMLITLCYVYLWLRFHKCYSALIRRGLYRLNSSSFSFSFGLCSGSSAPPAERRRPGSVPVEDNIFLQLGDKAVYVTEPQVWYRSRFQFHITSVPCGARLVLGLSRK